MAQFIVLIVSPLPTIGFLLPIKNVPPQQIPFGNEAEPLLRFSFAKFLANPCGLNYNESPSFILADNKENNQEDFTPFATNDEEFNGTLSSPPSLQPHQDNSKEAFQILVDSLRHQYNVNRSLFSPEELVVTIDEFFLILKEVKDHIKVMKPPMVCLMQ